MGRSAAPKRSTERRPERTPRPDSGSSTRTPPRNDEPGEDSGWGRRPTDPSPVAAEANAGAVPVRARQRSGPLRDAQRFLRADWSVGSGANRIFEGASTTPVFVGSPPSGLGPPAGHQICRKTDPRRPGCTALTPRGGWASPRAAADRRYRHDGESELAVSVIGGIDPADHW